MRPGLNATCGGAGGRPPLPEHCAVCGVAGDGVAALCSIGRAFVPVGRMAGHLCLSAGFPVGVVLVLVLMLVLCWCWSMR